LGCFRESARYASQLLRESLGEKGAETVGRIIDDHLETYDGRGPQGKKGDEVLAEAYILNLSVAIENMLEGRPNRNASERADSLLGKVIELADRQYPKIIVTGSITPLEELLKEEDGWWETIRLAELGRCASIVFHDMSNYLSAFAMTLEHIRWHAQDGGLTDLVASCRDGSDAVEKLVHLRNEMLAFARGDAKKLPGNMNSTMDEALVFLSGKLESVSIEKKYGSIPAHRYYITEMKHVFLNLIKNAVEALEGKEGRLVISTLAEGGFIHVSISDNGIGMTPEQLERVFAGKTTKAGGSGLGLPFCKYVVGKHDGIISFESRKGQGTTAHIWLPLEHAKIPDLLKHERNASNLHLVAHVALRTQGIDELKGLLAIVAPGYQQIMPGKNSTFLDESTGLLYTVMEKEEGSWQITVSRSIVDHQGVKQTACPSYQAQRIAELAGEKRLEVIGYTNKAALAVRISSGQYVSIG
jgi:signal transduction histidine kinase